MNKTVLVSDFRLLTLRRIRFFLKKFKLEIDDVDDFIKREPTPLLSYQTIGDIISDIDKILKDIEKVDNKYASFIKNIEKLKSRSYNAKNSFELVATYYDLLDVESKYLDGNFDLARTDNVKITVSSSEICYEISEASPELADPKKKMECHTSFLLESMNINEFNRSSSRLPTLEESALIEVAQQAIIEGEHLPYYFQSLGITGFREIQTYLSIADPGEGHESVIATSSELLKGVVVHVEHIDRDRTADKNTVEPYRLPAAINTAKVRVAIGSEAPVTAFIGRPMFENFDPSIQLDPEFELDLLKSSHYSASACSTMFMLGVADCKIGFERMTVNQSIDFAKAVVGNVIRDRDRQYLSGAFNLNTPLKDANDIQITDPYQIARKGIEIVYKGGFNKVTWDGASNEIPSKPIIDQLSHEQFITLIHEAHEKGLETYISAGLQPDHMERCVVTGVDGIGIGTSLHYRDPDTKLMGALKPEAIKKVLSNRDKAANTLLGRASKLLAKLDREYYEEIISNDNDQLRLSVFEALKAKDVTKLEYLIEQYVVNYDYSPSIHTHPLISQATRLETSKNSLLERKIGKKEFSDLKNKIFSAIKTDDITTLRSYLQK